MQTAVASVPICCTFMYCGSGVVENLLVERNLSEQTKYGTMRMRFVKV